MGWKGNLNLQKIHAHDLSRGAHFIGKILQPTPGDTAQVQDPVSGLKEVKPAVDLLQFIDGPGGKSLLLGLPIIMILSLIDWGHDSLLKNFYWGADYPQYVRKRHR